MPETPHDSDLAAREAAVDEAARRSAAALRRPAPPDGPAMAMRTAKRRRAAVVTASVVGAAVVLVGGLVILTRDDEDSSPSDNVVTTVSATTAAPTPSATLAPVTTVVSATAPPTTVAPTTAAPTTAPSTVAPTTPAPTAAELTQWALDFTRGTAGAVSGEPMRIGVVGDEGYVASVQGAAQFINAELGGVGGRPLEVDVCTAPESSADCGTRFVADERMLFVMEPSIDFALENAVGSSKVIVNSFGNPGSAGVSFYPNGARAGRALFDVAKVVAPEAETFAFFGVQANGPVVPSFPYPAIAVLDDAPSQESMVAALQSTGAVDADVFLVQTGGEQCLPLKRAIEQLGITPIVITNICSADEGWYSVNLIANPSEPDFATGALTWTTKNREYGGTLQSTNVAFIDVLNLLAVINPLGPPDEVTTEDINAALLAWSGPAMSSVSPLECGGQTAFGLLAAGDCSIAVDLYHYVDGEFTTLDPVTITE